MLREVLAQLGGARVGGVVGLAMFQGVDTRSENALGRDEIGLADAERDHVFHRGRDVEKPANA
jgi:hypothetical protein